jgi:NAD(P)-dependent dehydrogenase (short-subunit alcohol dehydrogenase family)
MVNNAGHGLLGALEELTDAQLRQVLEVDLLGAVAMTRAVLPHMRAPQRPHRADVLGRRSGGQPGSRGVRDDEVRAGGRLRNQDGVQPGDPVRAAQAIIATVRSEAAPLRLPLGRGLMAP